MPCTSERNQQLDREAAGTASAARRRRRRAARAARRCRRGALVGAHRRTRWRSSVTVDFARGARLVVDHATERDLPQAPAPVERLRVRGGPGPAGRRARRAPAGWRPGRRGCSAPRCSRLLGPSSSGAGAPVERCRRSWSRSRCDGTGSGSRSVSTISRARSESPCLAADRSNIAVVRVTSPSGRHGDPRQTTRRTASGCSWASQRASSPPKLQPTTLTGWWCRSYTSSRRSGSPSTIASVSP